MKKKTIMVFAKKINNRSDISKKIENSGVKIGSTGGGRFLELSQNRTQNPIEVLDSRVKFFLVLTVFFIYILYLKVLVILVDFVYT